MVKFVLQVRHGAGPRRAAGAGAGRRRAVAGRAGLAAPPARAAGAGQRAARAGRLPPAGTLSMASFNIWYRFYCQLKFNLD